MNNSETLEALDNNNGEKSQCIEKLKEKIKILEFQAQSLKNIIDKKDKIINEMKSDMQEIYLITKKH